MTAPGLLIVAVVLVLGALVAIVGGLARPRAAWLAAAIAPALLCYAGMSLAAWYVNTFIVNPNRLNRERPYIADNIQMTRSAYGLDRFDQHEFPAETDPAAADAAGNQATLDNIRLWDVQALQDTLRQVQEIRTYYDFPGIDIDRYTIDGGLRQVMLAVRELNVDKLPESSRNWINDKLIYTHGYGITMNPVNGFTTEGLPTLIPLKYAGAEHGAGVEGDAAGDLLRRDDFDRRVCEDAAAGVQLSGGADQQSFVVRGDERDRDGRISAARDDCLRSRRSDQGALQRRHHGRKPAADAPAGDSAAWRR